ncbi:MAG TPA: hypothetical protein VNS11_00440 [Sphingomicrobium sp.]|nr:hypothetical protein [Sphingomicrobium sp.]
MRRQAIGGRYLAGLVMGFALLYLAATCIASALAWRDTYPPWLLTNWLALGLVPSLIAAVLGRRAWSSNSAAPSAVALIVILVAIALWQLFVVSF